MTYTCSCCGKKNLPREAFRTRRDGSRYQTCISCRSKAANAYIRKKRGDKKPLMFGGISYKKVLPPEQWGQMEQYLRTRLYCADTAHAAGVTPDVWEFTRIYSCIGGERR